MTTNERMSKARTALLLDYPWFGSLAMRLEMIESSDRPTLRTNGSQLFFNPAFVGTLPDAHLKAIIAHEVMHCALLHPYRMAGKNPERWNKATDCRINADLKAAGFQLPEDATYEARFDDGMTYGADTIYSILGQEEEKQQDGGGGGQKQGNGSAPALSTGTVEKPAPSGGQQPGDASTGAQSTPAAHQMTEEDWKVAAEQASMVTRKAGKCPGGASESAKAARQTPEDWRAILREFIEQTQPSDYSWMRPNRRFISSGIYLPGIVRENLGTIGVAVDTSGSVSRSMLESFAAELTEIVKECRPESVHVAYCDTQVRGTADFDADDNEVILNAKGRGGTRFTPALEHFNALDTPPVCVLYFTDLENGGERVEEPSGYPVLWVTGKNIVKAQPFGGLIHVDGF